MQYKVAGTFLTIAIGLCILILIGPTNATISESSNSSSSVISSFIQNGSSNNTGDTGRLKLPYSVAVDSDGNVLVADTGHKRVKKFTSEGNFLIVGLQRYR
jgi:DNA-binding beta-propeller fold protein YncE